MNSSEPLVWSENTGASFETITVTNELIQNFNSPISAGVNSFATHAASTIASSVTYNDIYYKTFAYKSVDSTENLTLDSQFCSVSGTTPISTTLLTSNIDPKFADNSYMSDPILVSYSVSIANQACSITG